MWSFQVLVDPFSYILWSHKLKNQNRSLEAIFVHRVNGKQGYPSHSREVAGREPRKMGSQLYTCHSRKKAAEVVMRVGQQTGPRDWARKLSRRAGSLTP